MLSRSHALWTKYPNIERVGISFPVRISGGYSLYSLTRGHKKAPITLPCRGFFGTPADSLIPYPPFSAGGSSVRYPSVKHSGQAFIHPSLSSISTNSFNAAFDISYFGAFVCGLVSISTW